MTTQNNSSEFKRLYDEYSILIIRVVNKYIKDKDVAKDIVQMIFIKVWKNMDRLKEVDNVGGYIHVIIKSIISTHFKKEALRHERDVIFYNTSMDPLDTKKHDRISILEKLIEELPRQQKRIMEFKLKGLKYDDISKEMSIAIDTINHHMTSAYATLRKKFRTHTL